jgi:hypothetical protein
MFACRDWVRLRGELRRLCCPMIGNNELHFSAVGTDR